MNELSWLIYAADVAGSVKGLAAASVIVSGIAVPALGIAGLAAAEFENTEKKYRGTSLHEEEKESGYRSIKNKVWSMIKPAIVTCIVSCSILAVTPSQNTIYAIAASEVGERVITSETGGKAVKALNAWLDKQVDGGAK